MEGSENPFLRHIQEAARDWHETSQSSQQLADDRSQSLLDELAREMQERYETVVAQIPDCISCHFSQGQTYGIIMRLRYDESDEDPSWETKYWHARQPDPTKLQYAARQVFDYCHEHQLQPYLVHGYDYDVQKYFLYLGINCHHHI
jgi:hypothetical protein